MSEKNNIKSLLDEQNRLVHHFFETLALDDVDELFEMFLNCRGKVVMTGVGKSGFVAEKLAATLISTGTPALFLCPTDALHGDVGVVAKEDLFVMLSKSGESDELLSLIPAVRNKGAQIVSWVSIKGSRLEKASDFALLLPVERELCPLNLSPTTSPSVQMLFGDVMVVALMRARGFTTEQFAGNHPAGRIGKRCTLRVKDLMIAGDALPTARVQDPLVDKLVELSDKKCGCLVVVDGEGGLVGIFTDGDLRRSLQAHGGEVLSRTIGELMTGSVKSIDAALMAADAKEYMEADQKRPIMVLPVVEEGKVVGLIKMHDIIQSGL